MPQQHEEEVEEPAATTADEAIAAEDCAKDLKLIESLLARPNLFDGTRDELLGYKEDIAAGEFHPADSRYLRVLSKRLKN